MSNLAAYIFGSLFLLCAIVAVYRLIRCIRSGKDWPDDYPHGWE
jgi:hypothetical protein